MDKIKKMWCNLSLRKSIILYISAFVILAILLSAGTATLCNNATKTIESKYPPTGEKYYLTNENGERLGDGNYIGVAPVAMSEKDQRLLSICEVAPIIATPIYSALCIITATLLFYRNKLKKPLTELKAASEIKFELRKILTKRFAVISVAAVLLLSLILSFSTLHSMYAFDGNGAEETGKAAVEIDKQIALKYEGKLTDNKVQQMMSEFKPTQDLHGMNAKYIYQNALQSSVFSHFADIDGNWNGLSVADVFGDKEIKVGYVNGWLSTSQNMAKIFIVLSLVIILLIAPVFSGEYGGVDNIILTSKYGKTKCATAKVLASLLSAVFITTLVVIFNLLIAVAIYGTEGLDCSILFAPIDFLEGYIPFNISCGTVLKYQILLAFMSAISVTGIVLILSAVCKSQMIAFVISAAIHVIPIMLPISETSALYRIIVLMPLFYSQYISIMSVEQMHNGMLYAVWSIPVAIALVVIGSIISHKAFSKHQVR